MAFGKIVARFLSPAIARLQRFAGPFREFGAFLGTLYVLDRVLRKLSSGSGIFPYEFVLQPIPDKPLLPPVLAKHGRAERLVPGSPWLDVSGLAASVAAERFARGDCGVVALRKEQFTGYGWWATQRYVEQEVRCTFEWEGAGRSVFDFDVYVKPEQRMGPGFMAVWDAVAEELRQRGVVNTYSRISRFNLASLRAHARLGARPVGRVLFVRLGPLALALAGPFPFVRFAVGDSDRLRLRLGETGLTWLGAARRDEPEVPRRAGS